MSALLSYSETGINVVLELPTDGELDAHVANTVAAGVSQENMRVVTPEEILGSFATYTAWHVDGAGPSVAGFLRQRTEDNYAFPLRVAQGPNGEPGPITLHTYAINELGTLWVNPDFRGRKFGVADALVDAASSVMRQPTERPGYSQLPVAVCNPGGRKVFERCKFEQIGTIGTDRVVMASPPIDEVGFYAWYALDFRKHMAQAMARIPRYAGLVACGFDAEREALRQELIGERNREPMAV
ncbi:GNAT family N-acetyltransferase [Candidatus Saccharibacteria bacterium]|nr:MAG: GNAT family N-acetyltransferase [Candidatus Saccharibacteria bacterium]